MIVDMAEEDDVAVELNYIHNEACWTQEENHLSWPIGCRVMGLVGDIDVQVKQKTKKGTAIVPNKISQTRMNIFWKCNM